MSYPPGINDAVMFPAPPSIAVVSPCNQAQGACAISSLTLSGHPAPDTHFTAVPEETLDPGAAGRYVIAPLVESFPVTWTLAGHDQIRRLRLELYRRSDAQACWCKDLDYSDGGIAEKGSTAFNGDLHTDVHLESIPQSKVNVRAQLGANFPMQVLTAEHAPYKLVLRIEEVEAGASVAVAARWIYLDVLVHDIQLHLEGPAWLPPAGVSHEDQRFHQLVTRTVDDLNRDLGDGDLGATVPARRETVGLTMNVFSRTSEDFYSNAVFAGQKKRYRNDPLLPLRATLRIRRSDGTPASAQAGASALGRLGVQWDWESGERPEHPDATAQSFIAKALDYKPTEWPHARSNCHADHGGKRGANPQGVILPHFQVLPAGTLGGAANVCNPVGNRPWAASSQPIADSASVDGGKTGILFKPSRIAGDTYRLRVYLGYPDLDAFDTANAQTLQAAERKSVSVHSAKTLTVRHCVDVAHWRKTDQVDADRLDWLTVERYLGAACIDLRRPNGLQVMHAAHYKAAVAAHFRNLDLAIAQAADRPAMNDADKFAIRFKSYADFCNVVRFHGAMLKRIYRPQNLPNAVTLINAQLQAFGLQRPHGPRPTDLILRKLSDLELDPDRIRDVLLKAMGITDEASYKKQCESWGSEIVPSICGMHARTQSANQAGIHLYHFEFADQWFQQPTAAEASTTISNYPVCPDCAIATPTTVQAQFNRNCTGCDHRLDESAVVTCYAPSRYMNGDCNWSSDKLTFKQKVIIRAGRYYKTTAAITIAHEIGHHLGMPHAGPEPKEFGKTLMKTVGMYPPFHDAADDACIMSYNFTQAPRLHFCGLCSLRLAGWSMGVSNANTHAGDYNEDVGTLPLANQASFNQARTPAAGAALVTPVPSQCGSCNRAFTRTLQAHHCKLCGNVFCHDHSSHTRPVRNPLKADPVSVERVCQTCYASVLDPLAPAVCARWEPYENASACSEPGCDVVPSMTNRHHCRVCGKIHCGSHALRQRRVRYPLSEKGPVSMERVCDACEALYV